MYSNYREETDAEEMIYGSPASKDSLTTGVMKDFLPASQKESSSGTRGLANRQKAVPNDKT